MSVTITYGGNFGNNLFQYSIARLYAETHNRALITPWIHQSIVGIIDPLPGAIFSEPNLTIDEPTIDKLFHSPIDANVCFSGYFQQSNRYLPNRSIIRSWLKSQYLTQETNDIVAHIRADDYGRAHRIHPDWYKKILDSESYENLHLVMSPIDHEYITALKDYNPIVHSGSVKDDFELIASHKKIICSNSTFCWWAAFIGNPEKVFTFKPWLPIPEVNLTDLPNSVTLDGYFLE